MLYMKFPIPLKNLSNPLNKFSLLELFLLSVFIVYLVFPVRFPKSIEKMIETPLGMMVIFIIAILLFVKTNPILAILFIFVAYELLRRSSKNSFKLYSNYDNSNENDGSVNNLSDNSRPLSNSMNSDNIDSTIQPSPMETKDEIILEIGNTLEEKVVEIMSPIGQSDPSKYIDSSYKPIEGKESDIDRM